MLKKIIAEVDSIKFGESTSIILEDNDGMLEIGSELIEEVTNTVVLKAPTFKEFEILILEHHNKKRPLKYAFIDFDLGEETKQYHITGKNAIKYLNVFYPDCKIIAMSADHENNQALIAAGAETSFMKDFFKAVDWIKELN